MTVNQHNLFAAPAAPPAPCPAPERKERVVYEPKPYQADAMAAFDRCVMNGQRSLVFHMPTGTGKTVTGLFTAKRYGRVLWIAHRDELLTQPRNDLYEKGIWPDAQYGFIKGKDNNRFARDIVFASIDTLRSDRRLEQNAGNYFDIIVYDECHHAVSPSGIKVISFFRSERCVPPGRRSPLILGLSATLERADGKPLAQVFDAIAYAMKLEHALRDGFLVPWVNERYVIPKLDLSAVPIDPETGDYEPGALKRVLEDEKTGAAAATALAIATHSGGRKTVCFSVSVEQARRTAEELCKLGISAEWICGDKRLTPDDKREEILGRFRHRGFQVLCNAMILTEGWDDPEVECVCVARCTASVSLYQQMVGRGLRLPKDKGSRKEDCLLIDMVDAYDSLGLVSASTLLGKKRRRGKIDLVTLGGYDLEAENAQPEELGGDEAEPEQEAGASDKDREEADAESSRVRAFLKRAMEGTPRTEFSIRKVSWVEVTPDAYSLPMGPNGDAVLLRGPDGLWSAEVYLGAGFKPVPLVVVPIPVEMAQTLVEDHARKLGALAYSSKEAAWRRVAASATDVASLRASGFHLPAGQPVTQGRVADLRLALRLRQRYDSARTA